MPAKTQTAYRGEGYCFHSRLVPAELEDQLPEARDEERILVEAKPCGPREPRLLDACATLKALPEFDESTDKEPGGLTRLDAPSFPRREYVPRERNREDEDDDFEEFDESRSRDGGGSTEYEKEKQNLCCNRP